MAKDSVKEKEPIVDELFRGPRAGNTTQTMAPKTVNVDLWMPPKEEVYGPDEFPSLDDLVKRPVPKMVRPPVIAKKPDSLEMRVMKLEDRLDSLLDRIATHNVRSQHKI